MDERATKLKEELKAEGKDCFIVIMDDEGTESHTSVTSDRAYIRIAAAVGRACHRMLKR